MKQSLHTPMLAANVVVMCACVFSVSSLNRQRINKLTVLNRHGAQIQITLNYDKMYDTGAV